MTYTPFDDDDDAPGDADEEGFDEDPLLQDQDLDDEDDPSSDTDSIPCPFCGHPLYHDAALCPHCGNFVDLTGPSSSRKSPWIILGVTLGIIAILASILLVILQWLL